MIHIFTKKTVYNKKFSDLCLKSTNESIRRLIDKKNIDKKNEYLNLLFDSKFDDKNTNTNNKFILPNSNLNANSNNVISFIIFLSITPFIIYFYNYKK